VGLARGRLVRSVRPFSAAAIGTQFQNRDFSALGEGQNYLLPTTTKTAAAFVFADTPLSEQLHLHAGARVESVDIDGTPASGIATSRNFTPVSASAGLLFDASDAVRLGLTLASSSRAPAQTELFARGPHDGRPRSRPAIRRSGPSVPIRSRPRIAMTPRECISKVRCGARNSTTSSSAT